MTTASAPLISVIVPVYNVSSYLDRSLETLVAQTYRNLEIILVNDGSTDNSGELCDLWAARDSRIRVIHQKNGGLSRARNAGIDLASGDFFLFFDSDDLMSPDLCQVLYDSLGTDGDIAICDIVHVFPDKPYAFERTSRQEILTPEDAIKQMWYQAGFLPSAWAKLYRRHIFKSHRFTPDLRFEDIDILHELLWSAKKIVYNHSKLYGYVHRENSITTASFSVRDMDILKVTDRILEFSQDKPALIAPARAYATTAALRIYLNAPEKAEFSGGIAQAEDLLRHYGKQVAADPKARKKNRYALWLYFYGKPLLRFVYKRVNRWK